MKKISLFTAGIGLIVAIVLLNLPSTVKIDAIVTTANQVGSSNTPTQQIHKGLDGKSGQVDYKKQVMRDFSKIKLQVSQLDMASLYKRKDAIDLEIKTNDLIKRSNERSLTEEQFSYYEELLYERTLIGIRIVDLKLGKRT